MRKSFGGEMKRPEGRHRDQRGSALLFLFLILAVGTILGITLSQILKNQTKTLEVQDDLVRARWIAQAGMAQIVFLLKENYFKNRYKVIPEIGDTEPRYRSPDEDDEIKYEPFEGGGYIAAVSEIPNSVGNHVAEILVAADFKGSKSVLLTQVAFDAPTDYVLYSRQPEFFSEQSIYGPIYVDNPIEAIERFHIYRRKDIRGPLINTTSVYFQSKAAHTAPDVKQFHISESTDPITGNLTDEIGKESLSDVQTTNVENSGYWIGTIGGNKAQFLNTIADPTFPTNIYPGGTPASPTYTNVFGVSENLVRDQFHDPIEIKLTPVTQTDINDLIDPDFTITDVSSPELGAPVSFRNLWLKNWEGPLTPAGTNGIGEKRYKYDAGVSGGKEKIPIVVIIPKGQDFNTFTDQVGLRFLTSRYALNPNDYTVAYDEASVGVGYIDVTKGDDYFPKNYVGRSPADPWTNVTYDVTKLSSSWDIYIPKRVDAVAVDLGSAISASHFPKNGLIYSTVPILLFGSPPSGTPDFTIYCTENVYLRNINVAFDKEGNSVGYSSDDPNAPRIGIISPKMIFVDVADGYRLNNQDFSKFDWKVGWIVGANLDLSENVSGENAGKNAMALSLVTNGNPVGAPTFSGDEYILPEGGFPPVFRGWLDVEWSNPALENGKEVTVKIFTANTDVEVSIDNRATWFVPTANGDFRDFDYTPKSHRIRIWIRDKLGGGSSKVGRIEVYRKDCPDYAQAIGSDWETFAEGHYPGITASEKAWIGNNNSGAIFMTEEGGVLKDYLPYHRRVESLTGDVGAMHLAPGMYYSNHPIEGTAVEEADVTLNKVILFSMAPGTVGSGIISAFDSIGGQKGDGTIGFVGNPGIYASAGNPEARYSGFEVRDVPQPVVTMIGSFIKGAFTGYEDPTVFDPETTANFAVVLPWFRPSYANSLRQGIPPAFPILGRTLQQGTVEFSKASTFFESYRSLLEETDFSDPGFETLDFQKKIIDVLSLLTSGE
ncbi:MAG: hypothetical protein D6679_08080 [Candidatus Hydrogenedentota bacterium]|nr:MAG: hypothetical protein D6679_08080 [Candidatus Hydrogenedentota bacterium]